MTEAERLAQALKGAFHAWEHPSNEAVLKAATELRRLSAEVERLQASEASWVKLLAEDQVAFNDLTDEKNRLQAKVEALRKVVTEVRVWFSPNTMIGKALIDKIDTALAARPGECHHQWVNADNAHVKGTDLCLNCGAIRGRPGGEA